MASVTLSDDAQRDLEDIWLHVAADNVRAADHLIDTISERVHTLARLPDIGSPRDDLLDGLRSIAIGHYLVYYWHYPNLQHVEVARILHGARDAAALLGTDPAEN